MSSMAMKCLFFFFFAFLVVFFPGAAVGAGLKVGFYNKTCPTAEALVQKAVATAFKNNSGIAAGLIRLHFHDCFVRGCDGSVLIDPVNSTVKVEKEAPPNNPSLRGFEVIDAAKAAVEAACPRTVSCADILAFAARDSIFLSGNVTYRVPAGRRDGNISLKQDALDNLPAPTSTAAELVGNFTRKSLTAEDMVVLSGAHTVGRSFCSSFTNRLYNFSSTSDVDPTMSSAYAFLLKSVCPSNSSQFFPPNTTVDMDVITPAKLDNKYYVGLTNNLGLFTSDQALLTNATLKKSVDEFVKSENRWKGKFVKAMVKMGGIDVLTGTQGEVRLNCRVVNKKSSNGVSEFERTTTMAGDDESSQVAAI